MPASKSPKLETRTIKILALSTVKVEGGSCVVCPHGSPHPWWPPKTRDPHSLASCPQTRHTPTLLALPRHQAHMPGSSDVRAIVGWVRHRTTPRHAEGPAWLQRLQGTAFPASAKQVPADSRMVLITSVINNSKTLGPGCKPALSMLCSACFSHSAQAHHCSHMLGEAFTMRPWKQGAEAPHRHCAPELVLISPHLSCARLHCLPQLDFLLCLLQQHLPGGRGWSCCPAFFI